MAAQHTEQGLWIVGPEPREARSCLIMLHGRGGRAENMLTLYEELALPDLPAIAPQAPDGSWYPYSFLAPLAMNEPALTSSLTRIEGLVTNLIAQEIPSSRIALLGFSQGACLATEFAARHARKYGGLLALTGGLIGPPGTPREYTGSLEGTPVFLGTSDPDPHVPFERVSETKRVLERMGAAVELRRYPGMEHTVNAEEIKVCQSYLGRLAETP